MDLTRPKTSRGQRRAAVNSIQRPPVPPDSPEYSRPDGHLRSQSQPIMWQARQLSQDRVLQMLQEIPPVPPHSLNKNKVLPPIKRRQSEVSSQRSLDRQMSKLSLTDDAVLQQRHRHEDPDLQTVTQISRSEVNMRAKVHLRVWPKPPDPRPVMTKEAGASGSLLLAVQAPCGRRFQQRFDPADTLLMVRASAEARFGAKYGDTSIQNIDVICRNFTDMDMTLEQCDVLNASLLCISDSDSAVERAYG
ncbi:UBX domain-containing protein 10 [Chaetodon trifascialis]|uniref:UBX domain-containing protein 10 n=1 Tax=Chaetodon trifascialis TaxID=109706 RepID=UPI003991C223